MREITERRQTKKKKKNPNTIWYYLYVESKKKLNAWRQNGGYEGKRRLEKYQKRLPPQKKKRGRKD